MLRLADLIRIASVNILLWVTAVLLTGCAISIPIGGPRHTSTVSAPEMVYQAVSAVDFATTVNIARRPDCYREVGMPTSEIIGSHPTESKVYAFWATQSVIHASVSHWLDREADDNDSTGWRVAYWAWEALTTGYSAYNVESNYRIGLRPFGSGSTCVNK